MTSGQKPKSCYSDQYGVHPQFLVEGDYLAGSARSQHGVFMETFEVLPESWVKPIGTGTESLTQNGQAGGNALNVAGYLRKYYDSNIPFDPGKLYRIRCRVRRTATSDAAKQAFYCGVVGVAANGVTLVNINGADSYAGQHYNCAAGVNLAALNLNQWYEYTGWFLGWSSTGGGTPSTDPKAPKVLHENVRYIRPVFIVNYDGGPAGNVTELDYIALDVVYLPPAENITIADGDNRYTATEVETALQEIAGSGRTTQTVKANADAIALKVPTTRQIIAGVGLSGGGDLSADRTLTVAIPTLYIEDQKANNTQGGSSVAGAWTQRNLTQVVTNSISGASLASNRITLPAGTYFVEASAPAYLSNQHKLKLYNYTDSIDILIGSNEYSVNSTGVMTRSHLKGVFTLDAQHEVELRHYVASTYASQGFGVATNMGVIEVYSQIEIRKTA